jgi:hypothetical protein
MSDTKEYIKGDKHVHQAGSIMIKFAQYNVPERKGDWKQQEEKEAEELEKEFADFEEVVDETAEAPVKEEEHKRTFASAVVNVAKVDAVVSLLRQLMEGKTKPKDVLMPVRAAMDAGVIRRPTWEEFYKEFGSYRLKSKTSFSDYTNPDKSPYTGADFQMMKERFSQLMSEGQ